MNAKTLLTAGLMIAALGSGAANATSQIAPPEQNFSPAGTVRCVSADYNSTDTQPAVHICTQLWFNRTEQCYYNAVVSKAEPQWRVLSLTPVMRQNGSEPFCNIPMPPPGG